MFSKIRICHWTKGFLSAQQVFSVHKNKLPMNKNNLSAHKVASVHKHNSSVHKNKLSVRKSRLSAQKMICQCTKKCTFYMLEEAWLNGFPTHFCCSVALSGHLVVVICLCKSIRHQEDMFIHSEKHVLFLLWCSNGNFLFIFSSSCAGPFMFT